MNHIQDDIHYLVSQEQVSGMQPGDQPEKSHTMA